MKTLKKTLILFFIISLIIILSFFGLFYFGNSKPKINIPNVDYCHGIVLDEKLQPIKNVKVCDISRHQTISTSISGYFKLEIDSITSPEPLIFNKKGYQIDTVNVVDIMPRSENIFYRFMNKKPDTIIMKKLNLRKL